MNAFRKFRNWNWTLFLAALLAMSPALAEGDTTGGLEGEQAVAEEEVRPAMPTLFFSTEQRRILEALRKDVVGEEEINVEDVFVPIILSQEIAEEEIIIEDPERDEILTVNSFIKNRASGRTVLWVNNEIYDTESDKQFLKRNGISVKESAGVAGVITGVDEYNKVNFEIRAGQVIGIDGQIDETLPVIIKRK